MANIFFIILYLLLPNVLPAQFILVLFTIHCILIFLPYTNGKENIANPISLFILGAILVNIGNYMLIDIIGTSKNMSYSYVVPEFVAKATQIWCISCTLTVIGYQSVKNKSLPAIDLVIKKSSTLKTIFYILLAVNILQVLEIRLFTISVIAKFIGIANLIGILFFSQLGAKSGKKSYQGYAVTLFVTQTYIALFTSYLRIQLILPTLLLFMGYFIGKKDIKYVFSYRIIPFLILFGLYASVFKTLGGLRSNFYYAFMPNPMAAKSYSNDEPIEEKGNSHAVLDRSANLAQLTCVVNLVEKNGFYNGAASAPLIIALIPRFLWPEKPKIEIGRWFALEIGVAYMNEQGVINNSINMTVPGELYLDFGWIGVVLGSLLIGAFIAALWNATKFYSSEYNILGILFGGYLLFLCFIGIGVDLQVIITITSLYLSFLIVKKISNR